MKLSRQVCSLEPAKKLKKLGVKQESVWYWQRKYFKENKNGCFSLTDEKIFILKRESYSGGEFYSAFTVAELGEMLPSIDVFTYKNSKQNGYLCLYKPFTMGARMKAECAKFGKTEADARAKMLIYLIESKLIKVEDL